MPGKNRAESYPYNETEKSEKHFWWAESQQQRMFIKKCKRMRAKNTKLVQFKNDRQPRNEEENIKQGSLTRSRRKQRLQEQRKIKGENIEGNKFGQKWYGEEERGKEDVANMQF